MKHHGYKGTISSIKNLLISFSVAEIKLLILFCYYWVTIVVLSTTVSLVVRNSDELSERTNTLISCIAGGIEAECGSIREALQEDFNGELFLSCFGHALRAFTQWVHLIFVIQSSDVKAVYKKLLILHLRHIKIYFIMQLCIGLLCSSS